MYADECICLTCLSPRKIENSIRSLQSTLIKSVHLKYEIISVNISKTKADVILSIVWRCLRWNLLIFYAIVFIF